MPIADNIPKSLLCKYFAHNRCLRGTHCTFAHSLEELTLIPEKDLWLTYIGKEGRFNAWDGDLSPASHPGGLMPGLRECAKTMSWAIWALENNRTVPGWVPKLCFQAILQHGAPFLRRMQKVLPKKPRSRKRPHRVRRQKKQQEQERRRWSSPSSPADWEPSDQPYNIFGVPNAEGTCSKASPPRPPLPRPPPPPPRITKDKKGRGHHRHHCRRRRREARTSRRSSGSGSGREQLPPPKRHRCHQEAAPAAEEVLSCHSSRSSGDKESGKRSSSSEYS